MALLDEMVLQAFTRRWPPLTPVELAARPSVSDRSATLPAEFSGTSWVKSFTLAERVASAGLASPEDPKGQVARPPRFRPRPRSPTPPSCPRRRGGSRVPTRRAGHGGTVPIYPANRYLVVGEGPARVEAPVVILNPGASWTAAVRVLIYHLVGGSTRRKAQSLPGSFLGCAPVPARPSGVRRAPDVRLTGAGYTRRGEQARKRALVCRQPGGRPPVGARPGDRTPTSVGPPRQFR